MNSRVPSSKFQVPTVEWIVFGSWLALTIATLVYLVRFGIDCPYQDEWFCTPVLAGETPILPWLFDRHNEHVYPLGKLVWLAITRAAGNDWRAAAYISLFLQTLAALGLLLAIRRVRGSTRLVDVLIPALLLNLGHFENWLFGYQVVLMLPLAAQAAMLAIFLRPYGSPSFRGALAIGALTLVALNGGGFGLAVVPPVALWLLAVAVALRGWRRMAIAFIAVLAVSLTALAMLTAPRNDSVTRAHDLGGQLHVALEFLTGALGPDVAGHAPECLGAVVLAISFAACALLIRVMLNQPAERLRAGGLLALTLANLLIATGIGATREFGGAPRYAAPAALGLLAALFAFMLYMPYMMNHRITAALVLTAVLVINIDNRTTAEYVGELRRFHYRQLRADAAAGLPVEALGAKYSSALFFPGYGLTDWFRPLMRAQSRWFATIQSSP